MTGRWMQGAVLSAALGMVACGDVNLGDPPEPTGGGGTTDTGGGGTTDTGGGGTTDTGGGGTQPGTPTGADPGCDPGYADTGCTICEVGWGGADCDTCVAPYEMQGGVCVDPTGCADEQTWIQSGLPADAHQGADFTVGGTAAEPTVLDTVTGLEWRRCGIGQSWDGNGCTGGFSVMGYASAIASCMGSYGGHADWRAPTLGEVESLLNYAHTPLLDPVAFPNVPAGSTNGTWTSSTEPGSTRAAVVVLAEGKSWYENQGTGVGMICVRGTPATPTARYVVATDEGATDGSTVVDQWSGLEWSRCALGQSFDGSVCTGSATPMTWSEAQAACAAITGAAGDSMRLPSVRELRSIRDYCHLPAFDLAAFPGLDHGARFFTGTPVDGDATAVFQVDVDATYASFAAKTSELSVLCVN